MIRFNTILVIVLLSRLVCVAQDPVEIAEQDINPVNPPPAIKIHGGTLRLVDIPLPVIEPAQASTADNAAGLMIYVRPNPRHCRYISIPAVWEVDQAARCFVTPGQTEPVWFSLYSLKQFNSLSARIQKPLTNSTGQTIPIEALEIRYLRDWPQIRSLYSTSTYYITPELLESKASIEVPANQSRTVWITLRTPYGTKPGNYQTVVELLADSKVVRSVSLEVRVLPFTLNTPTDRYWAMYSTSSVRWGKLSDDALRTELLDYQSHGMNCVIIDIFGQTSPGISIKNEIVKVEFPFLDRFQRIRREIGFKGPIVLLGGPRLENSLISARGEKVESFFGSIPQMKNAQFNQQFRTVLSQLDEQIKKTGIEAGYQEWYYAGIDEPGVSAGRFERAIWEFQQAREANIHTWTTLHGPFSLTIAPYTTAAVFHRDWSVNSADIARAREEETKKFGEEFWCYGGGAYENQEGNMIHNRHHNGVMMYKAGLKGFANWTYQWPSGDPMSDFDSGPKREPAKKAMITYADPATGNPIPTLQWEGIRAGVDDYRYLITMDKTVADVRALALTQNKKEWIDRCDQMIKQRDARLSQVPWATPLPEGFDMDEFDNDRAAKLRWYVAQCIVELQQMLSTEKQGSKL